MNCVLKRLSIVLIGFCAIFFLFSRENIDHSNLNNSELNYIQVVGSSTVFPFATVVAEYFGKKTNSYPPIVESTGTGGGMKAFCSGRGNGTPDLVNASRQIKQSEIDRCAENNVNYIIEMPIGYDGLVIAGANHPDGVVLNITKKDLFLALAKQIPKDGQLISNPYHYWSDINPTYPNKKIKILGPPPTSGTRDSFAELVMEKGCEHVKGAKSLGLHKKSCHAIREDGVWQDMGENDNLIIKKVTTDPDNVGIFGFAYYAENQSKLRAFTIDGVMPSFKSIKKNNYSVARILYVYIKGDHFSRKPAIRLFAQEFISDDAAGEFGYLSKRGLIPFSKEKRLSLKRKLSERQDI